MAFPSGWTKKRTLTIPAAQVGSGGVSSFTIPLKVTATSAKADGSDLRVSTGSDGTGLLTVDVIEAVGSGVFWIRVGTATLSSVAANTLYLWSGNASATSQVGVDAYGAGYVGYWPTGQGGDRTANGNNFTMTGSPALEAGKFSQATRYTGSEFGSAAVTNGSSVALMAWANSSNLSLRNILTYGNDGHALRDRLGERLNGYVRDGSFKEIRATEQHLVDTWYHVAISATSDAALQFWVDAQLIDSVSVGTLDIYDLLGIATFNAGTARNWIGLIGQASALDTLTQAEVTTEYNATNEPAAFLTQGAEENVSTGNRRRRLIICGAA